jgi:hypothetical protein
VRAEDATEKPEERSERIRQMKHKNHQGVAGAPTPAIGIATKRPVSAWAFT